MSDFIHTHLEQMDLPAKVKERLEIRTAETVDEVLSAALEKSASTKSAS